MTLIDVCDIHKSYDTKPPLSVLKGVNLQVDEGQRIAIIGKSGAGKSTLLNILGLLDTPTSGTYALDGTHVEHMSEAERDRVRGEKIGFVFQDFHVLGARSVIENLNLKLATNHILRSEREEMIARVLDQVGLTERAAAPARLLSGGEKQRLSLARAVICAPRIILADEPTGNLDSENAGAVLEMFDKQADSGVAVIVITHDDRLSGWADKVYTLDAGVLYAGN
ncbi:MAG: ABC transporter ATP-binding protein [Actinomycetaceae bacterium]|nr:ABC transporter ATP-binding protein [Actinomycetaceae bacterium]